MTPGSGTTAAALAALAFAALGYGVVLWRRFRWRGLALLGLGLGAPTLLAYLLAWGWCLARPVYQVLYLQPDPVLGWKAAPSFDFVSTGEYGEFRVARRTNSAGFHDREWTLEKPPGIYRVALLGDSFVEAIQVPWEKTAAQLLERRLNATVAGKRGAAGRYEVMNFGIGNYGLGQCLLAYEELARQYRPDRVYVFVANFLLVRTVARHVVSGGRQVSPQDRELWVRPLFLRENGELRRHPPRDYAAALAAQERTIRAWLGPDRSRLKTPGDRLRELLAPGGAKPLVSDERDSMVVLAINLAILEELGRKVTADGGTFGIVDATGLFEDGFPWTADGLEELSAREGYRLIRLGGRMREAKERGERTRWPRDGHFNERGNELFADALFEGA